MISSINLSNSMSSYILNNTTTLAAKPDTITFDKLQIEDEYVASSNNDSSTEKTYSTSTNELKKTASNITACSKCGALYIGPNPPAICARCGNQINSNENSKNDPKSSSKTIEKQSSSTDYSLKTDTNISNLSEIVPNTISI